MKHFFILFALALRPLAFLAFAVYLIERNFSAWAWGFVVLFALITSDIEYSASSRENNSEP